MHVVAATGSLFQTFACPPGRDMTLVRSFVGREPYVAINPHHTFLGWTNMGRCEVLHGHVHGLDDRQHGLLQLALKPRLLSFKPIAPVVAFEAAQEPQPRFTKIWLAN